MHADAPIDQRGIVVGITFDRQAANAGKTATVDQLRLDFGQTGRERGQREIVLRHVEQVGGAGFRAGQRGFEFRDIGRRQLQRPARFVGDIGRAPVAGGLQYMNGHSPLPYSAAARRGDGAGRWPRTSLPGSAPVGLPSR